jgi:hypothetical protein
MNILYFSFVIDSAENLAKQSNKTETCSIPSTSIATVHSTITGYQQHQTTVDSAGVVSSALPSAMPCAPRLHSSPYRTRTYPKLLSNEIASTSLQTKPDISSQIMNQKQQASMSSVNSNTMNSTFNNMLSKPSFPPGTSSFLAGPFNPTAQPYGAYPTQTVHYNRN